MQNERYMHVNLDFEDFARFSAMLRLTQILYLFY